MYADKYVVKIIPILKKYGVTRASLFGSIVRGEETKESDIDILIEVPDSKSLFDMMDIQFELEDALKKKVDLIEYKGIKPALKDSILSSQLPIYPAS
ncbi:nucleotidyltransferase family protein [Patescibacteria group bacterium]|nr:nucleotidyltransferase family protein [Patescibacteria group bacterium]